MMYLCRAEYNGNNISSFKSIETWKELCNEGHLYEALQVVDIMHKKGIRISTEMIHRLLQGCISKKNLVMGRKVHCLIIGSNLEADSFLGSHLIRMFTSCRSLLEASQVFANVHEPSAFTWAACILAHAVLGQTKRAIKLFHDMKQFNVKPNQYVYVAALKACINAAALHEGKVIHVDILERGFESDVVISNTLIDMYIKCGSLEDAHTVFEKSSKQSVVTWTAMISGYSQHGLGEEAFWLFQHMQQKGMDPNKFTIVSILRACSIFAALDRGKHIHAHIAENGVGSNIHINNTLIDMYAKSGSLDDALNVFDQLPGRDVVTWSAMIAGYAQHGHGEGALQLFEEMLQEGMRPNRVTSVNVLRACSSVAGLEQGKQTHDLVIQSSFESDVLVGSTLIDMYAKWGSLEDARRVFDKLSKRNVVAWTAIIAGYALHKGYNLALKFFYGMQMEGLTPNDVTFVCLLSACSHLGLVDEGCHHFVSMMQIHGVSPTVEHYYCMVDLLGRAGHLLDAKHILHTVPSIGTHIVGWRCLLSHCKTHGDMEMGRHSFDHIITTDLGAASGYMLMLNIYDDATKWEDAHQISKLRKCAYAWKKRGKALIEIDNEMYDFLVGDKSHPLDAEISSKLKKLHCQMEGEGYLPPFG